MIQRFNTHNLRCYDVMIQLVNTHALYMLTKINNVTYTRMRNIFNCLQNEQQVYFKMQPDIMFHSFTWRRIIKLNRVLRTLTACVLEILILSWQRVVWNTDMVFTNYTFIIRNPVFPHATDKTGATYFDYILTCWKDVTFAPPPHTLSNCFLHVWMDACMHLNNEHVNQTWKRLIFR